MAQDANNGGGQAWIPMGSSNGARGAVGANGANENVSYNGSNGAYPSYMTSPGGDVLGISLPQSPNPSFNPSRVPIGSKESTPSNTPRADRPLLASPNSYSSPQFHQSQFQQNAAMGSNSYGGAAMGSPTPKGQVRFSLPLPFLPNTSTSQTATMGGDNNNSTTFEQPYDSLPQQQYQHHYQQQQQQQHQNSHHPDINAFNMSGVDMSGLPQADDSDEPDQGDDSFGHPEFVKSYSRISHDCYTRKDVHLKRLSWLPITVFILSIYSTMMSLAWFLIAAIRPRWYFISSTGTLEPTTASVLFALGAKTIELSFVTVFVTFLGQVLSRRAFSRRENGVTLAEMTMRNWVIQPGVLLTHTGTIRYGGGTILGMLTLLASAAAMFYTTGSDAMVTPKLMHGPWENRTLAGYVKSVFYNPQFAALSCKTPIRNADPVFAGPNCLDVHYSGNSYHNLMEFMAAWESINNNGTSMIQDLKSRPRGTASLFPNTTLTSAWIETEHGNVTKNMELYSRIVNNVTLAMPHPGVYFAATHPVNRIPQPKDLSGIGEYTVKASVVSPAVNVMCVDMSERELSPLIYTAWANALTNGTGVGSQKIGYAGWESGVPSLTETEFYNRTMVDDIFKWGPKYGRRPPIFRMYPANYNIITNTTMMGGKAMYVLGKSLQTANYTLCELQAWVTPKCSTVFEVSGTRGGLMTAHCEDDADADSYWHIHHVNLSAPGWRPNGDWRNQVDQLRLSINLDGGVANNNASNARLLTQLAVREPTMPVLLPSMAEALAVLVSSTLVTGAIDTPFDPDWGYPSPALGQPTRHEFWASVQTQNYQSTHADAWQGVFYVVLAAVVLINLLCFAYLALAMRLTLLTDYTEPANLFGLALMSPPSGQLRGCCGAGPEGRDLVVPFRVVADTGPGGFGLGSPVSTADGHGGVGGGDGDGNGNGSSGETILGGGRMDTGYVGVQDGGGQHQRMLMMMMMQQPHHYYFTEAGDRPWRGKWKGTQFGESPKVGTPRTEKSYKALSARKSWL